MLEEWVSRHGYFDPHIDWNDARSEMRVEQARTYMRDGTIRDAKENSLVPNTAHELEWAVPYAHLRQMVVSQVGVEHGSTSVLAYTVSDRKPAGAPLWGTIELRGDLPVLDQSITIEVPEGTPLRWGAIRAQLTPETASRGGSVTTTFRRRDVGAVNLAELPSGRAGVERLVYSTAASWADARAWLAKRVEAAIAPDASVKAAAEEAVTGATLDEEKISRVHKFVVDGLQAIAWPVAAFDYAVRPAAEVLKSSVGHPLDKAVLLAAMLRALGLEAKIALAASEREIAKDVPCLPQLDEVWVRVRSGPHTLWLDPAAGLDRRSRSSLAGHAVLLLDGATQAPEIQPDLDQASNRAALRVELSVADGARELGVSGSADLDLGGLYNPLRAFDRSEDRLTPVASRAASAFGGAKVKDVFVGHRSADLVALRETFAGGVLPLSPTRLARLVLPRVPGAISGTTLQIHRGKRTLPLVLPAPAAETVEVVLDLPEEIDTVVLPAEAAISNSVGSLARTVRRDGRKVTVRTEFVLAAPVVEAESYPDLRALFTAIESEGSRTVLLRRKE
jgi:transglutaminase-like putative cysteine protease